MSAEPYYAVETRTGFNVVHKGPYVVAKDLKYIEAEALVRSLNEENRGR